MFSFKKTTTRIVLGSVLGVSAVIAGAGIAMAGVTQTNGSDDPLHFYDGNGTYRDASFSWGWTSDVYGAGSTSDINAVLTCPSTATGVFQFISPRGSERTQTAWSAYAQNAFVSGTKTVLTPNLKPSGMILNGTSSQASIKAAGGNYSLGLACTTNNGVTVVGAIYRYISVTAGTGAYTAAATAPEVTASPSPSGTAEPSQTASIALSAQTVAAVDGALTLSVPANAAASFNSPTLVNNKSTATGTLPAITISDGRVVSRQGWTLTATIADFVNSVDNTQTIAKTNLGLSPTITSTTASGVTAGTATTAGSASYPMTFASATANSAVGDTVLGGSLTFVAPQGTTQGTYTSTMTLTLVSN